LLKGDKSLSLKLKSKYILSFIATLLVYRGFKALVYISAKVLATGGSLALLVSILFASFNTKVITILKSKRLVAILGLSHKN
jgi:ATP/ADP translocase